MEDRVQQLLQIYQERQVTEIVTHKAPHLDEIAAIVMLRSQHGCKFFPGASSAKIVTWDKRNPRCAWDEIAHAKDGRIMVGIGGGIFDEHGTVESDAKAGCATTLVARVLGYDKVPGMDRVLRSIEAHDSGKGGGDPQSFSKLVTASYRQCISDDPNEQKAHEEYCIRAAMFYAGCLLRDPICFAYEGKAAFEAADTFAFKTRGGQYVRVAAATTDVDCFPRYARSQYGNRAHVVIVQKPATGAISVLTVGNTFDLSELAKAVRLLECIVQNRPYSYDDDSLRSIGMLERIPEWYLHDEKGLLLNQSQSSPDAPATKITLHQMKKLVEWVIGGFVPNVQNCWHSKQCRRSCSLFRVDLPQCVAARKDWEG